MTTEYTLQEDLTYVCGILDSIPNINDGGCGLAALAIVRYLRKQGHEIENPFRVIYYDTSRYYVERNKEAIENGEHLERTPHIIVEIGEKVYDSTGEFCEDTYNYINEVPEHILVLTLNTDKWNKCFNRVKWYPHIVDTLGIDLSDVIDGREWKVLRWK